MRRDMRTYADLLDKVEEAVLLPAYARNRENHR